MFVVAVGSLLKIHYWPSLVSRLISEESASSSCCLRPSPLSPVCLDLFQSQLYTALGQVTPLLHQTEAFILENAAIQYTLTGISCLHNGTRVTKTISFALIIYTVVAGREEGAKPNQIFLPLAKQQSPS